MSRSVLLQLARDSIAEVLEAQFSSIKTLEQVVINFLDGDKKAAGAEFSKIKNLISLDPVISYWDKRLKIGDGNAGIPYGKWA